MNFKTDSRKLALAYLYVVMAFDSIEIMSILSDDGKNELLEMADDLNKALKQES
jgi:hypothetical protein